MTPNFAVIWRGFFIPKRRVFLSALRPLLSLGHLLLLAERGPGRLSGLREGDQLLEIDGRAAEPFSLRAFLAKLRPQEVVELRFRDAGSLRLKARAIDF